MCEENDYEKINDENIFRKNVTDDWVHEEKHNENLKVENKHCRETETM